VVQRFVYDAENRLVRVEDGSGGLIAHYEYDPFGRRLWKEVNGERTYFFYADEGLIAEFDESGNEIRSYGWQPDSTWGTNPLWLKQNGKYYWYRNDHLGTPQTLVDAAGNVVWQARYTAFGKADILVDTVENNLRFPGQYFDAETGLHYNYHRYYDPLTGRYTQPDPIGFAGGEVNWYAYVGNNPVSWIDPWGLQYREPLAPTPIPEWRNDPAALLTTPPLPELRDDPSTPLERWMDGWFGTVLATIARTETNRLTGHVVSEYDRAGVGIGIATTMLLPAMMGGAGIPACEVASITKGFEMAVDPAGAILDVKLPKSIDDILEGTMIGGTTKGKTVQRIRKGDFTQANEDFDVLTPSNVKNIITKYGSGRTGTLPNGQTITVRPGSTDGRPTLEIRNPQNGRGIEIRYGD